MISYEEWYLLNQKKESVEQNNNLRHFASPCPVTLFSSKIDDQSICDISGNLWQHTRSPLSVLPGFKVHYLYDDFTLPTIDGRHFFLTGGSFISLGNCASSEGRYGFRRHFYQFAGIRYVSSKNNSDEDISVVPPVAMEGELAVRLDENYSEFTEKTVLQVQPFSNGLAEFGRIAAKHIEAG